MPVSRAVLPSFFLALLTACHGGEYGGGSQNGNAANTPPGERAIVRSDAQGVFDKQLDARMDYCRSCHVPGGVADVEDGRKLLLNADGSDDLGRLRVAWTALGGGVEGNKLLTEPSSAEEPHSGGKPWPVGSDAHTAMRALLQCFDTPDECFCFTDISDELPPLEQLPLLASSKGLHPWEAFCEQGDGGPQPDNALLPADPRRQIVAGVNEDRAVYYNAYFEDCHVNLPAEEQQAKSCGDYRQRRARGLDFLLNELPVAFQSAADFNNSWQNWGLSERPERFDEMYTLRYGLNPAPFDNPYPRPGEDPNATDGGSGQLPIGLRQRRDANGNWTGEIEQASCFQCHGGQIGNPQVDGQVLSLANLGLGNNNYDVLQVTSDGSPYANTVIDPLIPAFDQNTIFNMGVKQRGHNNAVGAFLILNILLDVDSLGVNPNPGKTAFTTQSGEDATLPVAHVQDTPAWWNMSHRPRKFFDAGVSNDSTRIVMAAGPGEFNDLVSESGDDYRNRIEEFDQDLEAYFLSLVAPDFPGEIDSSLAETGAILFHTKDLWAEEGNADWPRPLGGNGSCAGCHGAYSPRYVNDDRYLETPAFEGVAGHISPHEVIQTDTTRADLLSPALRASWATTFWGYPDGLPGWVSPEDKDPATEKADDSFPNRVVGVCGWEQGIIGYQAPPLYGTWATAPYLHNGSVPTLEAVLNSSERHPIWRRKLRTIDGVTGFDQELASAYDFDAVGWQHDVLTCDQLPGTEQLNCNPVDEEQPTLAQQVENGLRNNAAFAGVLSIEDPNPEGFEKRLVYDTRISGNGNGGHEFTDVLSDNERAAIIEYLKTL